MLDKVIVDHKLYVYSIGMLCILTYLLNFCTAIYQCALVFTIIAIMTNAITFIYGKSKSLKGLASAIIISFVLLWKLPYYVDGKIMNGLVCTSFVSLIITMFWSTYLFQKLISKFNFIISNALSLVVAAIIDGFIMGMFFITNNNLSYSRVLDIFNQELLYKMIYGLLVSAIILIVFKIFKINKMLNYNLK